MDRYTRWEEVNLLMVEKDGRVEILDRHDLTSLENIYEIIDEFSYLP